MGNSLLSGPFLDGSQRLVYRFDHGEVEQPFWVVSGVLKVLVPGLSQKSIFVEALATWIIWEPNWAIWDASNSDRKCLGVVRQFIEPDDLWVTGMQDCIGLFVSRHLDEDRTDICVSVVLWYNDVN